MKSIGGMIVTCDPAYADLLPGVARYVRPQRVPDDVDLFSSHVVFRLQKADLA